VKRQKPVYKWLSILILVFLFTVACKETNQELKNKNNLESGTGNIIAQLVWQSKTDGLQLTDQKSDNLVFSSLPIDVSIVRAIVSAADFGDIQEDFDVELGTGVIDNIPIGTDRSIVMQGLKEDLTIIYEGQATNLAISEGETTNAGIITMEPAVIPTHSAEKVSFWDLDTDLNQLEGTVFILKSIDTNDATYDEQDISNYVLYWGSDQSSDEPAKLNDTPISTIAKTGSNIIIDLTTDTAIPNGATHFLVYTKNDIGEMITGINTSIIDNDGIQRNVPDTGSMLNYTTTFGEDSDFLMNSKSYTDNSDGTITDKVTKLIWQKSTDSSQLNWSSADNYCTSLSLANHNDWRVPTVKELLSIVDYGALHPAINETYFPDTFSVYYWTSTQYLSSGGRKAVFFESGYPYSISESTNSYVRCVTGNSDRLWVNSFVDSGESIVTQNNTSLMWQKEDDNIPKTWDEALNYCENLSLGNYEDWRLPNIIELQSITQYESQPYIDQSFFPGSQDESFWSSTIRDEDSYNSQNEKQAWIYYYIGATLQSQPLSFSFNVRCARSGNNGKPTHTATNVTLVDTDTDSGQIAGDVNIAKSNGESSITQYTLYWGSDAATKNSVTPIATINKTGSNLTYSIDADTEVPVGATHLLVFSKNSTDEMETGISMVIYDDDGLTRKLTDTGQTTGMTATFGEDADYSMAVSRSYMDNADETITDNLTKLMWQQLDDNTQRSWAAAASYCSSLSLAGHSDWRLPNVKELMSFIDYEAYYPSINETYFPNTTPGAYWSADSYSDGNLNSWGVDFSSFPSSAYYDKNSNLYTRCVRGDSTLLFRLDFLVAADIITHNGTGLAWQKEVTPIARPYTEALDYCESLSLNGQDDWRLPNNNELLTIVNYSNSSAVQALDINFFSTITTTTNYYWSATAGSATSACMLNLSSGALSGNSMTVEYLARCIRGGEVSVVPTDSAKSISFSDTDTEARELAGDITIVKADDETFITHYALYWGSTSDTKLSSTPIATIAQTGNDLTYSIAADTIIPEGAFYLLVYTQNDPLEAYSGVYSAIVDNDNNDRQLPDTGQVTSYTDTVGEDFDFTSNPPSYTDNSNDTITDNNTQLVWQKEASSTKQNWTESLTYCSDLDLAGYNDWRVPNIKELFSIVNVGFVNSGINETYFSGTELGGHYWSSTTSVDVNTQAKIIHYYYGHVSIGNESKSSNGNQYVRCVRNSHELAIWPFDFTEIDNTVINHSSTGLMWRKTTNNTLRTWEQSLNYCQNLSSGGYEDWRLPNIMELQTIIDYTKAYPAINQDYFSNTPNYSARNWTSTTHNSDNAYAYLYLWDTGNTSYEVKMNSSLVTARCVRSGQ
jgi:hypothetical protein